MRDQGTASENVLSIDLSHIDEKTSLGPEDLSRVILTIENFSTEVIDPTFATGQNTKTLISLCQKMESLLNTDFDIAVQDQLGAVKALENTNTIANVLNKDEEKGQYDLEYAMVLQQIRDAEKARLRAITKYADATKEFGAAIRTMIKLGNGLLTDQEEHGASIKAGKSGLKYAFTCKAIDGQWKALKVAFLEMRKFRKLVEILEERRETEKVVFVDTENGNELVAGETYAQLSKAVAEIIADMEKEEE